MNLFAYGTLLLPEVWQRVVGAPARSAPARLRGFRIRRVAGDVYPVMFAADAADVVDGLVFFDLSEPTIALIDDYESGIYRRLATVAECGELGSVACCAYVLPAGRRELASQEPWDVDWFRRHALADYLRRL